jgi:hypothetical protein
MQHKFAVGERVAFTRPGGWRFGVDDVYLVMRQLPGGRAAVAFGHAGRLGDSRGGNKMRTDGRDRPVSPGSKCSAREIGAAPGDAERGEPAYEGSPSWRRLYSTPLHR